MPFNGSGVFTPAVTFADNTEATAEDQNTQDIDIASGLTACMTRAGLSAATANWNMGGFKLTGLGAGSVSADSVSYGQVSFLLSIAANSVLGNNTGSPAAPIALTQAQLTALVNAFSSSLPGSVPASGGGVVNYLRADGQFAPPFGYDLPINMGLSASVATNALTINLLTGGGATPSATNPVLIPFRSTTLATGTIVWTQITSALSIVVPSTATLGTSNGVPFRIWLLATYNAGVPQLAVVIASVGASGGATIYPVSSWESTLVSATAISTSASSAGVLYATGAVSSDAVRIIGFAEYANGLTTAGTWASAPTTLEVIGPKTPRPGERIQSTSNVTTTEGSTTSSTFAALSSGQSLAITPTSAVNPILARLFGTLETSSSGNAFIQLARGATLIGVPVELSVNVSGWASPASLIVYDLPGVATSTTYNVYGKINSGTLNYPLSSTGSILDLEEIMG